MTARERSCTGVSLSVLVIAAWILPRTGSASTEGESFIKSRSSFHQRERVLVRERELVEGRGWARAREQERNLALGQVRLSRQLQELV
jgi:hypothetical protein